ncbi:MAG: TIGR03943 family protein [Anaerolineae bacterium]|nr:TIGR03943 family protein [Anaerolineae bacterium]
MTAVAEHVHDHEHHDHARERRMAWAKTAILIGLGLYFVYNIVSGNLSNYINLRFGWLSYVAAGLFFLMGGFSAYTLIRSRGQHTHAHDHDNHLHPAPSWGMIAIVALPLVLGTLVPSQPLGVEAVSAIDLNAAASQVSNGDATMFTISPENRNVLDWLRVFNQTDDYSTLNNLPVDVIGFVYSEPDFGADQFMTARFTISCCVADANAIGLPVVWANAAALPQGEWVHVRGHMQAGEFRGETTPIVHAETVEVIESPQNPYLYP